MARLLRSLRLDGVLVTEIEPSEPPSQEDLQALMDGAGGKLPPPYLDGIRQRDGFEDVFGGPEARTTGYVSLGPCRSILETVATFEFRERGSSLLPVGGDGGGERFAFDLATGEWVVVTWIDLGFGSDEWCCPTLGTMLRGFVTGWDEDEIGYEVDS